MLWLCESFKHQTMVQLRSGVSTIKVANSLGMCLSSVAHLKRVWNRKAKRRRSKGFRRARETHWCVSALNPHLWLHPSLGGCSKLACEFPLIHRSLTILSILASVRHSIFDNIPCLMFVPSPLFSLVSSKAQGTHWKYFTPWLTLHIGYYSLFNHVFIGQKVIDGPKALKLWIFPALSPI